MNTVKPEEKIGYRQHGALAERLDERGVNSERFNRLFDHPDATIALIELLGHDPVAIKAELDRLVAEIMPLLPRFEAQLSGWKVIEDRGQPLPTDFDPAVHLGALKLICVHAEGETYLKGETLLERARERQGEVVCFSQAHADWYLEHWDDERIPKEFRQAVETGDIYIVVTDTVLLGPNGGRYVLCLYWYDGRLLWDCSWLDDEGWDRSYQVVVPGDSSV